MIVYEYDQDEKTIGDPISHMLSTDYQLREVLEIVLDFNYEFVRDYFNDRGSVCGKLYKNPKTDTHVFVSK